MIGPMESAGSTGAPRLVAGLGRVCLHSLFPIAGVLLILGTVVWGPWITLLLAWIWWKIVGRTA